MFRTAYFDPSAREFKLEQSRSFQRQHHEQQQQQQPHPDSPLLAPAPAPRGGGGKRGGHQRRNNNAGGRGSPAKQHQHHTGVAAGSHACNASPQSGPTVGKQPNTYTHGSHPYHPLQKTTVAEFARSIAATQPVNPIQVQCSICSACIIPCVSEVNRVNTVYLCSPCDFTLCHKCYAIEEAHFPQRQVVVRKHTIPLDAPLTAPMRMTPEPPAPPITGGSSSTRGKDEEEAEQGGDSLELPPTTEHHSSFPSSSVSPNRRAAPGGGTQLYSASNPSAGTSASHSTTAAKSNASSSSSPTTLNQKEAAEEIITQPVVRTRPRKDAHMLGSIPPGMLIEVVCSHTAAPEDGGDTYVRQSFGAWIRVDDVITLAPTGQPLDAVVAQYQQYAVHGGADLLPIETLEEVMHSTLEMLDADPQFGIVMASFVLLSVQLNTSNPEVEVSVLVKSALLATAIFEEAMKQLHVILRRGTFTNECSILPSIMGRAAAVHWSLQQREDLRPHRDSFFGLDVVKSMNKGLQLLGDAITRLDACRSVPALEQGEEMKQLWSAVGTENVTAEAAQTNCGAVTVASAFTLISVLAPSGQLMLPAIGACIAAARVSPCANAAFAPLLLQGIHDCLATHSKQQVLGGGRSTTSVSIIDGGQVRGTKLDELVEITAVEASSISIKDLGGDKRISLLQQGLVDCDCAEFCIRLLRTTKFDREVALACHILGHLVEFSSCEASSARLRHVVVPTLMKVFGQPRDADVANALMQAMTKFCFDRSVAILGDEMGTYEVSPVSSPTTGQAPRTPDRTREPPYQPEGNEDGGNSDGGGVAPADCGSKSMGRNLITWYLCAKTGPKALCPHCRDHCAAGEEWQLLSAFPPQLAYVECTCPYCTSGSQTVHPGTMTPIKLATSPGAKRGMYGGNTSMSSSSDFEGAMAPLPIRPPPSVKLFANVVTAKLILSKLRVFRHEVINTTAHLACVLGLYSNMELAIEMFWCLSTVDQPSELFSEYPDVLIFLSRVPDTVPERNLRNAMAKCPEGSALNSYLAQVRPELVAREERRGGKAEEGNTPSSGYQPADSSLLGLTPSPATAVQQQPQIVPTGAPMQEELPPPLPITSSSATVSGDGVSTALFQQQRHHYYQQ